MEQTYSFTETRPTPRREARPSRTTTRLHRPRRRFEGIAVIKKGLGMKPLTNAQFVGLIILAVLLMSLYVSHVRATQQTLAELQSVQQENHRLQLMRNRVRGELERAGSPDVVLSRAKSMGLEEGLEYGPTVKIKRKVKEQE